MLWQREFGGPSIDIGYSIRIAPDGSYIAGGQTTIPGDINFYLVKTDTSGFITGEPEFGVQQQKIRVYPNPVSIESRFIAPGSFDQLRIIDVTGRVLFEEVMAGRPETSYPFPFTAGMRGMVLLELWNHNQPVYRTKVLVR
jgi:hypothetical protein